MNNITAKQWLLIFGVSFFGLGAVLVQSETKLQNRKEVIIFSHKFHQAEAEASCTDCHAKASESQVSSDNLLPGMDDCANCHDVEDEEECEVCHPGDEESWTTFELAPASVNYSHKFHVTELKVDCKSCHTNLSEVDLANAESRASMDACSECHNNQQASLECVVCHTSTLNLRPNDHTADFIVAHKNIARIEDEQCAMCHSQNDCSECHEGGVLLSTSFTAAQGLSQDKQAPFAPSSGTKGLRLARVHGLNFRFTHPIEAQGRAQECSVCHESVNFCQTCHEAEGVDVAGKPGWHGGSDWGAVAGVVGTGGGRHAELAKRDIESCAACHSTEGDDPACLLCHTDFDNVQGTNPQTHDPGFANRFGDSSSFHEDDSALCYSCHVNSEQSPTGFCGSYCHELKE